ncbi:MAG TPA: efflux RND transporter periplasmic adaptor subunit [Verrucomicrobiae bacterium]|nr:efflux RND transporter periplasmic adaptor subunit [Verrucomicrobiae bacterium]
MITKLKITSVVVLLAAVIGAGLFAADNANKPDKTNAAAAPSGKTLYTCGMHPWIIQDHPGNCPICGMKLEPVRKQAGQADPTNAPGQRKILYWRAPMDPTYISDKPGKSPMGMDLVPVYADQAAAASSSVITVDPVTIQEMDIRTTPVVSGPLRRTIRTVGTIDYNETALADVTTKFKGWIEKLDVDATGDLVHRGEPLFSIYSPELYSAEVEYLLTLRQTSTNDPGAAVLRETAENKLKFFDISDAQIAELAKTGKPRKTLQILAPADGFVIQKNVIAGQMVDAGMKLYQLADLGLVWVYAQIYEQDLPYIQLGQEAVVRLSSMPDREFHGRVTYIYPNVDEKTRTARVRMEFENPGYFLKPGMFVSVQITSELKANALLVPNSAIVRSGTKNTVFVALPGGKFDPRTVVLGPEAEGDQYQVVSGLQAGENVVTSGEFMLDSESQLREAIQKMREPASTPMAMPATATTNVSETQPVPSTNTESESVVYVCPMPAHVSITYDHPGKCPICGMTLVPVTPGELKGLHPGGKVLYYTCPMPEHHFIHEDKPGKCPICGMTLIPVMAKTAESSGAENLADTNSVPFTLYTCSMHLDVVTNQPGKCPICGMNLVPTSSLPNGKIAEEHWREEHQQDATPDSQH